VEAFPKRSIHPDKYRLRQYLVDESDPELGRILHLIGHQDRMFRHFEVMDQKSIVLYLNRKGWMARVIHDDLVATLGDEAIAYSTVTKYLREAQTGPDDANPSSEEMSHHIDDSEEDILSALEELSFSSVRQLSHATHLPATMAYR
jgi:hypothetical protein